ESENNYCLSSRLASVQQTALSGRRVEGIAIRKGEDRSIERNALASSGPQLFASRHTPMRIVL
ncbi:hypothetical protein ACFQZU_22795, partial [Streptomonospora algeriensis]